MTVSDEIFRTKLPLRFRNSRYKILCVSDIHGGVGYDSENTVACLQKLIDGEEPDLVLLLGDIAGPGYIHIETAEQLREMLDGLTAPMENAGIPWAHIYGNHDDNFGVDNRQAQAVYEAYAHCVSKAGDPSLPGCGNYVLPVYDEKGGHIIYAVYCLDSHAGDGELKKLCSLPAETPVILKNRGNIDSGERGVDFSQVLYYRALSDKIKEREGKRAPALMVMHVPLQEFAWCAENPGQCSFDGITGEPVSCQNLNAGMFRACLETGDVRAMCFGHDHENNCSAEYCGIFMANDGYLSFHASHTPGTRGGRVFVIDENNPGKVNSYFVNV